MKKIWALRILILFFMFFLGFGFLSAQEAPKETISLKGTVAWDDYKSDYGPIIVSVRDQNLKIIGSVEIPMPGEYSLVLPSNSGEVKLSADLKDKNSILNKDMEYSYEFPLKIADNDIVDANMRITKAEINIMRDYKGPVAIISGKVGVEIEEYNDNGEIAVCVTKNPGNAPRKLFVKKIISAPGEYTIEVPAGSGTLYVWAIYQLGWKVSGSGLVKVDIANDNVGDIDLLIRSKK